MAKVGVSIQGSETVSAAARSATTGLAKFREETGNVKKSIQDVLQPLTNMRSVLTAGLGGAGIIAVWRAVSAEVQKSVKAYSDQDAAFKATMERSKGLGEQLHALIGKQLAPAVTGLSTAFGLVAQSILDAANNTKTLQDNLIATKETFARFTPKELGLDLSKAPKPTGVDLFAQPPPTMAGLAAAVTGTSADYLKRVADTFAKTEEYRIQTLKAEIDFWEKALPNAAYTKDEVEAILRWLKGQLPQIAAATAVVGPYTPSFKDTMNFNRWLLEAQLSAEGRTVELYRGTTSLTAFNDETERATAAVSGVALSLEEFPGRLAETIREAPNTFGQILGDLFSGGGFSLGSSLAVGMTTSGPSDLAGQLAIDNVTAFGDELQRTTTSMMGFAGQVLNSVAQMGLLGLLFEALKPVLQGFFGIIAPALDGILAPLMGSLIAIGQVLSSALMPILTALTPVFELMALEVAILVTVIDFLARPMEALADLISWVIAKIKFWISGGTNPGAFTTDAFTRPLMTVNLDELTSLGTDYLGTQAWGTTANNTSVQRPTPIFVYVTIQGSVWGAGGAAEVGREIGKAIEAFIGTGGVLHIEAGVVP